MKNIGIKLNKENNLSDAIIYYLKNEKIDYELINENYDYKTIIYVGYNNEKINVSEESSVILINDTKTIIENHNFTVNYIITDLINDDNHYTDVQKEYLFKKGAYNVLIQKVAELIENVNDYNALIYDLREIKVHPYNWIFKFESINETYNWLSRMNRTTNYNFTQKNISFYSDKVYDDSVREINYLTEQIMNIKDKKNLIDIFILDQEEYNILRKNYFFKSLANNLSDTYSIYLIDKNEILNNDSDLLDKLRDGIIIYEDCVYKDTYNDEFSLGYVDCKKETVEEYSKYFDYILEKYGKKLTWEVNENVQR